MKTLLFLSMVVVAQAADVSTIDVPRIDESSWTGYTPLVLKEPVPVRPGRNPFQPAVIDSTRRLFSNQDEASMKLQAALDGKISSVVRGRVPTVLVGSRIFRQGDEFYELVPVNGPNGTTMRKASFLQGYRLTLKSVDADKLVFRLDSTSSQKRDSAPDAYYQLDPAFVEKASK